MVVGQREQREGGSGSTGASQGRGRRRWPAEWHIQGWPGQPDGSAVQQSRQQQFPLTAEQAWQHALPTLLATYSRQRGRPAGSQQAAAVPTHSTAERQQALRTLLTTNTTFLPHWRTY